jgi:eukaryotic-like serine/threonine-protein kinase
MAPEQAKGRPVSKATDIWAFGCVLYEMLTGRAVFAGDDVTEVLAAVVRADPDWKALPPSTPREIRTLLRHCLHKDQRRRWQDAASLRIGVDEALNAPVDLTAEAPSVRRQANRRTALVAGLTGLAVAAVAVVAVWSFWPTASPLPTARLLAGLAPAQRLAGLGPPQARPTRTALALSPDGQSLVFVGEQDRRPQLYMRRLDRLEATPIPGTDGADSPFFSPDGQWIGFWQAPLGSALGEIKKVPVDGGPAVTVCRAPLLGGVSWGSHGRIVFAHHEDGDGLWHVAEDGGTPEKLTTVDAAKGEFSHRLPYVLPGGDAILFTIQKAVASFDNAVVAVRSLVTGDQTVLVEGAADARYVPSGHLVYARMGTLMAQRFDLARLTVTGGPIGVLDDVMHDVNNTLRVGNSGAAQFTISSSGPLAYVAGGITPERIRTVVWIDRRGTVERIPLPPGNYFFPLLSPDETQILLGRTIYDLGRGTLSTLVTLDAPRGAGQAAIWHPDGQRLTASMATTGNQLWEIPADGSGKPKPLSTTEHGVPMAWSPDAKTLAYLKETAGLRELWLLSLPGADAKAVARRFISTPLQYGRAQFSPDGRYLAYESSESGRSEVYVQTVSGAGRRVTISGNGGSQPVWARHGRELFYRDEEDDGTVRIMAVDVTLGETFSAGAPRALFAVRSSEYPPGASPRRAYDVTRDGKRFLMVQQGEDSAEPPITQIVIVQSWLEELKRTAPAK